MIQALEIHVAPGNDDYQAVWRRVIPALSDESTVWQADRLDCLYACALTERRYTADALLAAVKDNNFILSARLMALPDNQPLSHPIFTAGDFCASNCESIVFCSDLGFFDVFPSVPNGLSDFLEPSMMVSRRSRSSTTLISSGSRIFSRDQFVPGIHTISRVPQHRHEAVLMPVREQPSRLFFSPDRVKDLPADRHVGGQRR